MKTKKLWAGLCLLLLSACGPMIGGMMVSSNEVKDFKVVQGNLSDLRPGSHAVVIGPFDKTPEELKEIESSGLDPWEYDIKVLVDKIGEEGYCTDKHNQIKVYKENAWANFNEQDGPDGLMEIKNILLEKVEGEWKIVSLTIIAISSYE